MKQPIIDPDLVIKIKTHFNISNKERAWLEALWHHMKINFTFPEYRQIRAATVSKTGTEFNPRSINSSLATNKNDIQIRFLGLLLINPNDEIFKIGLQLIVEIRQQLLDDADNIKFLFADLAEKLKIDIKKLNLSFLIFSDFFSMWSRSGSNKTDQKLIDRDYFEVESESSLDFYLSYSDLNLHIWEKFQQLTKEDSVGLPLPKRSYLGRKTSFIDYSRLKELEQISNSKYDLTKLIQLSKEIEWSFVNGNYYATALLQRAFIDHIPPLFNCKNFGEVVNNYKSEGNSKSFKKSMEHLDNSLRAIGDSSIHSQIRQKEVLPSEKQVDFSNDFDVLLAEIVRILK